MFHWQIAVPRALRNGPTFTSRRSSLVLAPDPNPSWGTVTGDRVAAYLRLECLLTPHGERSPVEWANITSINLAS